MINNERSKNDLLSIKEVVNNDTPVGNGKYVLQINVFLLN